MLTVNFFLSPMEPEVGKPFRRKAYLLVSAVLNSPMAAFNPS